MTQKKHNNSGLSLFKAKVYDIFKKQREQMQSTKRETYDRVSRFFPYDAPFYLLPSNETLSKSLIYEDVNTNGANSDSDIEEIKNEVFTTSAFYQSSC